MVSCRFPDEEPEGTLEDCGGDNSPMRNVFSGDFHLFEPNLERPRLRPRIFDFASSEEDDEDEAKTKTKKTGLDLMCVRAELEGGACPALKRVQPRRPGRPSSAEGAVPMKTGRAPEVGRGDRT